MVSVQMLHDMFDEAEVSFDFFHVPAHIKKLPQSAEWHDSLLVSVSD